MSHPHQVLASPAKKHGLDCMLLFMWLNFPAALHGHGCILGNHDNEAGPALGRSLFLRMQGVLSGRGQTDADATQEVYSLHESKNKSTRPTHEILLSVWSVLMLVIIYFDIFGGKTGGIYSLKKKKKKSLDIFGV